jgi:hypothetical protein
MEVAAVGNWDRGRIRSQEGAGASVVALHLWACTEGGSKELERRVRRAAHRRRDLVELDLVAQNERDVEHPRASPDRELNPGTGLFGAQALTHI